MILHLVFHLNIMTYLSLGFSFTNCNKNLLKDIEGVKLIVQYPVVRDGEILYLMDTVSIFYFKNYVLYKVPHLETYSINGELIREEKTFDSFLFEIGSSYGFLFLIRENSAKPQKLPVDSFLLVRAYQSGFRFDFTRLTLVGKKRNKHNLTEAYIEKSGTNSFDSIILSFNKSYGKIPYSFNSQLDSARRSKLVEISMVLADSYSEQYRMRFPRREFIFKIEKLEIPDSVGIKTFIENLIKRISGA